SPLSGWVAIEIRPNPTAPPSVRWLGRITSKPTRGIETGLSDGPPTPSVVSDTDDGEPVGRADEYATPATRSSESESMVCGPSAGGAAGASSAAGGCGGDVSGAAAAGGSWASAFDVARIDAASVRRARKR